MRSSPKSPKRKRSSAAASRADDAVVSTPAATVALASNCTVKDAAALKVSLCAVVNEQEPVLLDAGSVERIDTATVQLLCAFVRERAEHSRGVTWQGTSAALLEAARLLGVQTLLALPPCGELR